MLLARDPKRFDAPEGWFGTLHTRTGRQVLETEHERIVLQQAHDAVEKAGLWEELNTDWLMLGGELMPWSLKAELLIQDTSASVDASAIAATDTSVAVLERAANNGNDVSALLPRARSQQSSTRVFRESYRRYVGSPDELRFAAFQVLAAEGASFET